jgi:DNA-binding transcriptional ArsR family regulator
MDKKSIQFRLKNENIDVLIQYISFRKALLILRSVNHDFRRKIIELLNDNASMNVTQLYIKLRIEQSVVSQHLTQMRKSEILICNKQGKNISYQINTQRLLQVLNFANALMKKPLQTQLNEYNFDCIDSALHTLHVFENEIRLRIIQYIHNTSQTNVNGIYKALKMEQSSTSQQLRILRIYRIVIEKKIGKEVIYTLNDALINHLTQTVNSFLSNK